MRGAEDWRDVAVNFALTFSNAHWLWFTEQDFFVYTDKFWQKTEQARTKNDFIIYSDHGRMHPASLMMRKSALDKTKRYFGIIPDKEDHFAMVAKDLRNASGLRSCDLKSLGLKENEDFEHLNGLSHNHALLESGQRITYKPERFREYLVQSLSVLVPLDGHWISQAKGFLND